MSTSIRSQIRTCAFDTIFSINVPHILEKIFFFLDYDSFQQCRHVNKAWNDLLTSDSYLKKAKSIFHEEILEDQKKLLYASLDGNTKDVKSLLHSGLVDVNFVDRRYFVLPIAVAAGKGHKEVVQVLLDHGADVNSENRSDLGFITPLQFATDGGNLEVMKLLLDRGAEPNKTNTNGWTPLHYACNVQNVVKHPCRKYQLDVIKLLLDRGADPTLRERSGKIPLDLVDVEKHQEVAKILTERGFDLSV